MRAVAGSRWRAHARPDGARARPPPGRSAGLRARRDRHGRARRRTRAGAADAAAPAAERVRHGCVLRAVRGLPARSPRVTATCRCGTRSRSRASRSRPIRSRACSTRRRSWPTACSRRRRAWSLLVTFHYLLATLSSYAFARLVGAGRLGAVYAGLAFGVSGYLLARSQALGLLTGAAWLAACVAAAQFVVRREGRGASPVVLAGALALSILGGSQQLTAVAATSALIVLVAAAALARPRDLRRPPASRRSASRRWRCCRGSSSCQPLDGRQRRDRSGGRRHARDGPTRRSCSARSGRTPASSRRSMPVRSRPRWRCSRSCAAGARRALPLVLARARDRLVGRARRHAGGSDRPAALDHGAPGRARAAAASRSRWRRWPGSRSARPGARPSPWLVAGLRGRDRARRSTRRAAARGPTSFRHSPMLAVLVLLRSPRILGRARLRARARRCSPSDLARHDYAQQNPHQPAANWDPGLGRRSPRRRRPRASCSRGERARGRRASPGSSNDFTRRKQLRFVRGSDHADLLLGMAGTRFGLEDVAGYDPVQLLALPRRDRRLERAARRPTGTSLGRACARRGCCGGSACATTSPARHSCRAGMPVVLRTPQATVVRDDKAMPIARVNRPGRTDAARIVVRDPDRVVIDDAARPGRQARAGRSALSGLVGEGRRPRRRRCATRTGSSAPSTSPPGATRWSGASQPRSVKHRAATCSLVTLAGRRSATPSLARRVERRRSVAPRRAARAPSASSAGGALGQIESATTRPLAASVAELGAHALDAPAARRGEARVRRQARVEHVGVDVHVERRVGRERGQRAGGVVGLVQLRAIDVVALARIEIAAADEHGALLGQRRLEAGLAAPVVEAPAEQLGERHAAEEAARRRRRAC